MKAWVITKNLFQHITNIAGSKNLISIHALKQCSMSTDCSQVFYEKAALETSEKFTGKQLKSNQALVCNYTKRVLHRSYFSMNLVKCLREKFFQNTPERLLLKSTFKFSDKKSQAQKVVVSDLLHISWIWWNHFNVLMISTKVCFCSMKRVLVMWIFWSKNRLHNPEAAVPICSSK